MPSLGLVLSGSGHTKESQEPAKVLTVFLQGRKAVHPDQPNELLCLEIVITHRWFHDKITVLTVVEQLPQGFWEVLSNMVIFVLDRPEFCVETSFDVEGRVCMLGVSKQSIWGH